MNALALCVKPWFKLVIHSIENIIASSANTVKCNYRTIIRHSTTPHNVILFGKDGEGRVH